MSTGFEAGSAYFDAHADEIRAAYGSQYVAVTGEGVIAAAANYSTLADRVFADGSRSLLIRRADGYVPVVRIRPRIKLVEPRRLKPPVWDS